MPRRRLPFHQPDRFQRVSRVRDVPGGRETGICGLCDADKDRVRRSRKGQLGAREGGSDCEDEGLDTRMARDYPPRLPSQWSIFGLLLVLSLVH